jgi:hypothetical protein
MKTRTYGIWAHMRCRCNNKNADNYHHYGGRGIKVCDRWDSFQNFVDDMGEAPANKSIDRIDPNGDYTPSNCRWATSKEQQRNKQNTRWVVVDGARMSLSEAAELRGLKVQTLWARLSYGWPLDKALSKQPRRWGREAETEVPA